MLIVTHSNNLILYKLLKLFVLVIDCYCCSLAKLCLTLCDFVNCSMPDSPVLCYLLECAQTHVH